jgi:hypothetical protein
MVAVLVTADETARQDVDGYVDQPTLDHPALGASPLSFVQRAPSPRPSVAPRAVSAGAISEGLGVLQRAQRAIASGDGRLALSLLEPLGTSAQAPLAEERDAARAMALCLSKDANAASNAARFAREAPNSIYLDRVQSLCAKTMR